MYPFGTGAVGDQQVAKSDDGYVGIATAVPFSLYGVAYTSLYASMNGYVSFGAAIPDWVGCSWFPTGPNCSGFPTASLAAGAPVAAAWYADADTEAIVAPPSPLPVGYPTNALPNSMYLRKSTSSTDKAHMASDVAAAFSTAFSPAEILVVTWFVPATAKPPLV